MYVLVALNRSPQQSQTRRRGEETSLLVVSYGISHNSVIQVHAPKLVSSGIRDSLANSRFVIHDCLATARPRYSDPSLRCAFTRAETVLTSGFSNHALNHHECRSTRQWPSQDSADLPMLGLLRAVLLLSVTDFL